MRRLAWLLYKAVTVSLLLLILALNARLYQEPDHSPSAIQPHLHFLKQSLLAGSGEAMQKLFPEGHLFNYALYGCSWIDLAIEHPELKTQALEEARWALAALGTEVGRRPFRGPMELEFGVFYRAWSNWLRGGIVHLDPEASEAAEFVAECEVLATHLKQSGPFLNAYPGQAWPCDTTVAVACLALHDSIFPKRYDHPVRDWLKAQGSELFAHQVRPQLHPSRGTSQVIIQRFLFEIDPATAREHYEIFRRKFVTTRFGLPGVREYPLGTEGRGDIDSGPLIFGFSFSATGVVPGAARLHGDEQLRRPFGQLIQTFGFPLGGRYLGGQLPVADALLVWSRTATSWCGHPAHPDEKLPAVVGIAWRWGFHLFWLVVSLILLGPWLLQRAKRERSPAPGGQVPLDQLSQLVEHGSRSFD